MNELTQLTVVCVIVAAAAGVLISRTAAFLRSARRRGSDEGCGSGCGNGGCGSKSGSSPPAASVGFVSLGDVKPIGSDDA